MPMGLDFVIPALALLVTGVAGWVTGKTAQSKGHSFGLFFGLSFISWFIMATIAVFIKSRPGFESASATDTARSRVIYFSGITSYIAGVASFVISWGNESTGTVSGLLVLGPILIIGSIVLMLLAVIAARPRGSAPLGDFEIS